MLTDPVETMEKTRKPSRSSFERRSRSAVASTVRVTTSPVGVPSLQMYSAIGLNLLQDQPVAAGYFAPGAVRNKRIIAQLQQSKPQRELRGLVELGARRFHYTPRSVVGSKNVKASLAR